MQPALEPAKPPRPLRVRPQLDLFQQKQPRKR
jgi:hypothetical protein